MSEHEQTPLEQRFQELRPASAPPPVDLDAIMDADEEGGPVAAGAPSRAARRPWMMGALAVAAAALLAVLAWPPGEQLTYRGGSEAGPPALELRLYLDDAPPRKLGRDEALRVGDRVLFEIAADRAAQVHLRMEGPEAGELGHVEADVTPRMLPSPNGLMAWEFAQPGRYRVLASEDPEVCAPPACDVWDVEVASP